MIELERISEYRALGYTQEFHGIPMYKIFYIIQKLRNEHHLATSKRIAEEIGEYTEYVISLLEIYKGWRYVLKKPVKTSANKYRNSDHCIWHWQLNERGEEKLKQLEREFGEMIIIIPPTSTI